MIRWTGKNLKALNAFHGNERAVLLKMLSQAFYSKELLGRFTIQSALDHRPEVFFLVHGILIVTNNLVALFTIKHFVIELI